MGYNRPLRAPHRAVPRARRGAVDATERLAPQLGVGLHALPLVLHLRHRLSLVLP